MCEAVSNISLTKLYVVLCCHSEVKYDFKLKVFSSVLYGSILHSERQGWHEKILKILDKEEDKDVGLLAHHHQAMGSPKALDFYSMAAEGAWEVCCLSSPAATNDTYQACVRVCVCVMCCCCLAVLNVCVRHAVSPCLKSRACCIYGGTRRTSPS